MKTISKIGLGVSVFALAVAAVGCGSQSGEELTAQVNAGPAETAAQPEQSAFDAVEEFAQLNLLGQWGPSWEKLHPAQQKVVTRSAYMDCRSNDDEPTPEGVEFEEVESYEEPVMVAPLGEVPSTAVTVRMSLGDESFTKTVHAVDVDGEWRFLLPPEDIEAYQSGDCPI